MHSCLIWAVEEGITSESGLKDIISQVKKTPVIIRMIPYIQISLILERR